MEKLGQLLAQDRWDLVVVDTPPSRNALDFLDAPKRLGSFMDSRLWRLLLAPGRGIGRLVTGAMGLAMKAMSTILGSQMLGGRGSVRAIAGRHVRRFPREGGPHLRVAETARHPIRRGVGGRTRRVARGVLLRRPAVAGRHAAGGAGLEPHPSDVVRVAGRAGDRRTAKRWRPTADSEAASLAAAVLQIHADRAQTAKREIRLLSRFTGANPHVPVIGVPSLPFDVSDLEALRALADQITAAGDDRAGPARVSQPVQPGTSGVNAGHATLDIGVGGPS